MTTTQPSVRRPALALLLWAWYTLLAFVVASPFFAWFARETAAAPETDALLDGLQFGTLFELLQASPGSFGDVSAALAVALGLALLSNALLGGGLFALLAGPASEGRLLARFFEAAGRFFLRSLGLIVLSAVAGLTVGGAVAALGGAVLTPLLSGAGERGNVAQAAIVLLLIAAVAAFFLLALDYARVWMVQREAHGVFRTWLRGASFVIRHPVRAATPGVVYGLAILVVLALAGWVAAATGSRTWGAIAIVLLAQQALLYARVLLRVGLVAAEGARGRELEARAPSVPAPAAPAGPPA
jgi:hypothetical protein